MSLPTQVYGAVSREKVIAVLLERAEVPSSICEVEYADFNADAHSGGLAFVYDHLLTVYGFGGGMATGLDPIDHQLRLKRIDRFWKRTQHDNRTLGDGEITIWHRAAIAALVTNARSVAELTVDARAGVIDTARADALLVVLRRRTSRASEEAAMRVLAANDSLLTFPGEHDRAHPCPVCGSPALGKPWNYLSVCDECREKTECSHGRAVTGHNTHIGGGFQAAHRDDRSQCLDVTSSGKAWLMGHECRMGEAKFGGTFVGVAPVRDTGETTPSSTTSAAQTPTQTA